MTTHETSVPEKLFTLDSANAALPLVQAICRDMADLSRELIDRRHRLDQLLAARGGKANQGDPYSEELADMESAFERDLARIHEYVAELRELGVEPKSAPEGLVDFPAMRDGRIVYLCWKLGEPRISFWHELDAGFAGRQAIGSADEVPQDGSREFSSPSNASTTPRGLMGDPSEN